MNRPGGVGTRKRIGEILREGGFITEEQLKTALDTARQTGKKIGQVLIEQAAMTPETLASILSFQLGVPIVDLKQVKIDPEAVRLVPAEVARERAILPLSVDGDSLRIAMEDPSDLATIDALVSITGKQIRPVIPIYGGIKEAISNSYRLTSSIEQRVREMVAQSPSARAVPEPLIAAGTITQAPIVQAVQMIVQQAVNDRASDVHIEPTVDALVIRYRIDGVLHEAVRLPLGIHAALISRLKVMANMNIAERRRPQDGQFSMTLADREVDFRVATAETTHGEKMVIRLLDKSLSLMELADLGLQRGPLEAYLGLLRSPFGMILVSGPTGSGKTTTLYTSLHQLDHKTNNIMTIEDPVEYRFDGIHQIQLNRQADITFAAGLRAIMRMDPDIILVGEIRDGETASTAVQAALTGHLVLTSIHANDAASALVRLIDLGVEPFLVTSAAIGAVAQRLVRRVCPYCRQISRAPAQESIAYQEEIQEVRTDFYYGRGCNFCSQTGFLGRIGVYEVMPVNEQIRQLISRNAPASEIKAQAIRDGMVSLRRDGMMKARDGITTPGEIVRHVFTIF